MRICIGGSFDHFHKGHKKLIDTAFQSAGENGFVYIGIMDKKKSSSISLEPFKKRKRSLEEYIQQRWDDHPYSLELITDEFGPLREEEYDGIVVSPETKHTAQQINHWRQRHNKRPLKIIEVPFLLAKDNIPISSTRIRKGEITPEGKLLHQT